MEEAGGNDGDIRLLEGLGGASQKGTSCPPRPNPSFVRVARNAGRAIPKLLLTPVHIILIGVARLRHAQGDGLGAIQKIMQRRLSI